ncbi:MAG: hypothetical protein WA120_03550 [Candidatus Hydromicrobium sp.]|jgi:hypothetical protein|nr:hypothetical protein [Actinomycetota bacterium]MBE3114505.1 hypothetical protein [Actinomycetota bacterium]MCJ7727670.1 hypothetical protein [Actinomycetota bacterium]
MAEDKKIDKKDISFIIGGAIIGAIAGYIVKRVGIKNIMNMLKQKEIIPPSISNLINEFTSRKNSEE